jgi:hypothetical protein
MKRHFSIALPMHVRLALACGTRVQNLTAPFSYAPCNQFKQVSVCRFVSMTFPWKPTAKLITVSYEGAEEKINLEQSFSRMTVPSSGITLFTFSRKVPLDHFSRYIFNLRPY